MQKQLDHYKKLWGLSDDGESFNSYSSLLQPVLYQGLPCMLKIALGNEERRGNNLMAWWNGNGAADVLQHDDAALLMKRATGKRSLAEMARKDHDNEASQIICSAVAKLHGRPSPYPDCLVSLNTWFKSLKIAADQQGNIYSQCLQIAQQLLARPQDIVALHGDIHHGNILDFEGDGWLVIDPKGLIGERGFDHANIFCNPDHATATAPGRLEKQVKVVADAAQLNPNRLLQWIAAWGGLSSAWAAEDNENPEPALAVARIALNKLNDNN